ncbi:MAG: hypothetical protein COA84_13680 [Robiginitomaculum sp.]|nr:MAG: hypothetical protein COA84_13680 [Robiginitomaculum sp.]
MQKFNKATLAEVRVKVAAALKSIGIDNVDFQVGTISYSEHEATIKIGANIRGGITRAESALKYQMLILNLNETNEDGDKLVEYKSRNSKFPWIYICGITGKRYKCDDTQAKYKFA